MGALRNHIPNALSLSRIPIAFLIVLTYTPSNRASFNLCVTALVFALVTDVLDGKLARFWGVSTEFGYFLDGLCDKVIYSAILVIIAREPGNDLLLPWILILREILIYAIRSLDGAPLNIQRRLRPLSMTYAFFVRFYFFSFFLSGWSNAYTADAEWTFQYFSVLGYIAALCGYGHLYATLKLMCEQS